MPAHLRPLNPDDGPLARFALELRELRDNAPAGRPISVDQVANQDGVVTSRASVYAALAGRRLPSRPTLQAMIKAWAPGGLEESGRWNQRRAQVDAELAGLTPAPGRHQPTNGSATRRSASVPPEIREFSTALNRLVTERDSPSPREASRRSGIPSTTLRSWFQGQTLPRSFEALDGLLSALGGDSRTRQEFHELWYKALTAAREARAS